MVKIPYGETLESRDSLKLYCDWLMEQRNDTGFFNVFEAEEQMYEWYMVMYPVRALLIGGKILDNKEYIDAALYYIDLYIDEQLPNGAFTSNCRRKKGSDLTQREIDDIFRYGKVNVADNGSNVAAMLQACEFVEGERREKYLNSAKRWFDGWVSIWKLDTGAYTNGLWEGHKRNTAYSCAIGTVTVALSMYGMITGDYAYVEKAEEAIKFQCDGWSDEFGTPKFFNSYPDEHVMDWTNDYSHTFYIMEGMVWTHMATKNAELKKYFASRIKEWLFSDHGLLSQWDGNWFNYLVYCEDTNQSRYGCRLGWEMAKSNGIPSLWMYYLNNIEDDPRLRAVVKKAYTHLNNPLDARMSGIMSDPNRSYGSFAVQSTGFGGLSLAEKVLPGSVYEFFKS